MKPYQSRLLYLSILLLFSNAIHSQYYDYKKELNKSLCPKIDSMTTTEIATCLAARFREPEYSIRLVEINSQPYIEARILETNLDNILSTYWKAILRGKDMGVFSVNKLEYKRPITRSFCDKVLNTFSKVIVFDDDSVKPKILISKNGEIIGVRTYDGTTYNYSINIYGLASQIEIDYELQSTDFRALLAGTFLQIINDLRDGKFDETKYSIFN